MYVLDAPWLLLKFGVNLKKMHKITHDYYYWVTHEFLFDNIFEHIPQKQQHTITKIKIPVKMATPKTIPTIVPTLIGGLFVLFKTM